MHTRQHTHRPRFEHVALAAWVARHPEDDDRSALHRDFPELLEDFEHANGHVCRWYLGHEVFLGACLTEHDDIVITLGRNLPSGSDDLVELLGRCQRLTDIACHRLSASDRRMCQNMIFTVIEEALRLLDNAAGVDVAPSAVGTLHRRLTHAEAFMLRCGLRRRHQLRSLAAYVMRSA